MPFSKDPKDTKEATQQPIKRPQPQVAAKANNDLAIKGALCIMIGLGVVASPYFITSPGVQSIVASSAVVGWFALVLGLAFVGLFVRRRFRQ